MNKKIRLIYSIVGMTAFGFFAAALSFNSILNGKYAGLERAMDLIAIPLKAVFFLIHAVSGNGLGESIEPYLFATVLYFAAIGFLLGRLSYSVIHKGRN
jgi:hypothetical protein